MGAASTEDSEEFVVNIKLRYATLINFVARTLSLFASIIFVVGIARRLSVEEFGIWTLMFKYMSYLAPFRIIYRYWLPRTIARGNNTSKVGIVLSLILGSLAVCAYLALTYMVSTAFNQPWFILALASIIVFEDYINEALMGIMVSHSPQYMGIAALQLRVVQAALGMVLVVMYRLGLIGAVISVIVAKITITMLLMIVNYKVIKKSKFDREIAYLWIKRSWLPLYASSTAAFLSLDAVLVRMIMGSEVPLAYYGVSISILSIVTTSGYALPTLYSRLLSKGEVRDVIETIWIVFMLATPLAMLALIYTDTILSIYNPKYVIASTATRTFIIASMIQLFTAFLGTTLMGLEKRDF